MRTTTLQVDTGEVTGHGCDARAILQLEELDTKGTKIRVRVKLDRNTAGYLIQLLKEYAQAEKKKTDDLLKEFTS